MAGVTRLELATSCVTGAKPQFGRLFRASFHPCKHWLKLRPVDTKRHLVLRVDQFVDQSLYLGLEPESSCQRDRRSNRLRCLLLAVFQFTDSLLDDARLGFLQHHMVADLNEKRRPQLEGRLRAAYEGYDVDVESVSEVVTTSLQLSIIGG